MDLTSITINDFKNQFPRAFAYLIAWSSAKAYNVNDEVSYSGSIYKSIQAGTNKNPTTETAYWVEITLAESDYINDSDIERSFMQARVVFNQSLFQTDDYIKLGFLYLSAHYLVMDLGMAKAGLNSQGAYPVNSRSVGNVSESYSVPEWITKDKILSYYTLTGYGMKYLSLISGAIVGNVQAIGGATQP